MAAPPMKTHPQIQAIYVATSSGMPMQVISQIKVVAGIGLVGDRYALGVGAYSATKPPKVRHISLIALTGIEIANEWLDAGDEPTFEGSETRRNIVLKEISPSDLNGLVGQIFRLGNILLKGTELCEPCERPSQLLQRSGFMDAFEGRGGIRAEVLNSGMLAIGDELFIENEESNDSI